MSLILHGVVHGKTIELSEPAGLPDGREVRLVVVDDAPRNGSSGGFSRPKGMDMARAAFDRDLPALLADKNSAGRWFLYHGHRRVKAARSQLDLVRYCQKQGWSPGDCYIDMAIPRTPEPETVDPSLFEAEE